MKRPTWIILGVLLLVAAAGGLGLAWRDRVAHATFLTDADTIRTPLPLAPARDILWQPAAPLPPFISGSAEDYEPRLSWDGLTLYFVRGRAGANADLYTARRTPGGWTEPEPLAGINSEADELGPEPSRDGTSLYFYSNRAGSLGGYDLWVARRTETGWREPTNLGPGVNSRYNDYGPALSAGGDRVYFASNRPRPEEVGPIPADAWPATIREDIRTRDYDLYSSHAGDQGWSDAVRLAELCSPFNEGAPALSPFADFLYFASDRPGGLGGFDLYRSRNLRNRQLAPENLGPAINSAANELDPALAMGGYELFFSSDRPRPEPAEVAGPSGPESGPPPGAPERAGAHTLARAEAPRYDLYSSTSREVFRETDWARAGAGLRALLGVILPWLLWVLLGLLAFLILLLLLRDARWRSRWHKLSLLAKCLLVSLALHMLLLSILTAVEVGGALGDYVRGGGTRRVILTSGESAGEGPGGGVASQLLADLTDFDLQPAAPAQTPRAEDTPFINASAPTAALGIEAPRPTPDRALDAADPADASAPELAPTQLAAETSRPALSDIAHMAETPGVATPEADAALPSRDVENHVAAPSGFTADSGAPIAVALTPEGRASRAPEVVLSDTLVEDAAPSPDSSIPPVGAAESPGVSAPGPGQAALTLPAAGRPQEARGEASVSVAEGGEEPRRPPAPRAGPGLDWGYEAPSAALAALGVESSPSTPDAPSLAPSPGADTRAADTLGSGLSASAAPDLSPLASGSPRVAVPESTVGGAHAGRSGEAPGTLMPRLTDVRAPAPSAANGPTGPTTSPSPAFAPTHGGRSAESSLAGPSTIVSSAASPIAGPAGSTSPAVTLAPPGVGPLRAPASRRAGPADGFDAAAVPAGDIPGDVGSRLSPSPALGAPRVGTPAAPMAQLSPRPGASAAPTEASLADRPTAPGEAATGRAPVQPSATTPDPIPLALPGPNLALPTETAPPPDTRPQFLTGSVRDAATRLPLRGATVRLDLAEGDPLIVRTDEEGQFALRPPRLPDHVAVTASLDDYIPESVNIPSNRLRGGLRHDFLLRPIERDVISLERDPEVHHLGNSDYSGSINSQFQKRDAEGVECEATFVLAADQTAPAVSGAEIVMLAKGCQAPNEIRINGNLIEKRLTGSPQDGSFGEYRAAFPASWLAAGANTLHIRSTRGNADLDDFEFVNVRILLTRPAP